MQMILHKHLRSHIIMACKLVIMKTKRADTTKAFFVPSVEMKASVDAQPSATVVGERNIGHGLVKIRTLFFPNPERYAEWQANATIQGMLAARDAHNVANGITSHTAVIDLPNYNAY
jgi:hypothetical protein